MVNIQLKPVDSFKIPIDLLSKTVLHTNLGAPTEFEKEKSYWDENGNRQFRTEKFLKCNDENTKSQILTESKKRNIYSEVTIVNWNNRAVAIVEFDFAVLDACITEKLHGNEYTTANIIFHRLGGGRNLTPKMRRAILNSIEKLASVRVTIQWENAVKKNIVHDPEKRANFTGYLLPTENLTLSINGKEIADVIHLMPNGVIINNANIRNQISTCEKNLMNPNIRTTPRTVAINHYLLRRSREIIGSNDENRKHVSRLRNIITFEDMYDKIGLANGTRKQKLDAREISIKILDFFVESGLLKGYTVEDKNGCPYSIIIDF